MTRASRSIEPVGPAAGRGLTVILCTSLIAATLVVTSAQAPGGSTGEAVQRRIDEDIAAGRPLVVHVVVALADNEHQGIVRVPPQLGDGRNPRTNLYWGALYGVRTHLLKSGWRSLPVERPGDRRILQRIALETDLRRGEKTVALHLVADAWDGAEIRGAIGAFLKMAAGRSAEPIPVGADRNLQAGGAAHLVAFVGHNGLMDFRLRAQEKEASAALPRSAIVLACASAPYFGDLLKSAGAQPLLLTTGLMAPEAYTLDAALRAWIEQKSNSAVRDAAAIAYDRYQHCGLRAARRLFEVNE